MLAALGEREQPGEMTAAEKAQARKQAFSVWWKSILAGVLATVVIWFLVR